jgi:hypothetical protein
MYRIRHHLVLTLVLLLGTVALASAQGEQPDEPQGLPLLVPPTHMAVGEWEPLTLEPVDPSEVPITPQLLDGSDTCSAAPTLNIPGGAQSVTNDMTNSPEDPALACMWASPGNPQGYRTTWFKFNSPFSGLVTIDTAGSTFDTVLAVYSGGCAAPVQLACNDDYNYFSSRVSVSVFANQDYYVEVADWHLAVSGTATANIAAWIDKETDWVIDHLMSTPRTRHSAVVLHDKIYVIGGQTISFGNPVRTPRVDLYNTTAGNWSVLTSMPAGSDGLGYSNTSAAHVNNMIYLPSGYVGNNGIYDGTHWVYNIGADNWYNAATAPWAGGQPAIYHTAVSYTGGGLSGYYVVGGLTGPLPLPDSNPTWEAHVETYFFNPAQNSWSTRDNMTTGRFGHTAAIQRIGASDYICVVGGIGHDGDDPEDPLLLSAGECFDIAANNWTITTAALNYPRYNAGSAVDQDGNWYVFGGTNNLGESVAVTERYDRATNTWTALPSRFNLGSEDPHEPLRPARAWARGGFVNQYLWVVGGHRNTASGDLIINLVEKLFLPLEDTYIPLVRYISSSGEPDDTFANARQLFKNQPQHGAFHSPDDYVDVYYFQVSTPSNFTAKLSNMADGVDYDLALYRNNKVFLNSSNHIGNMDETLNGTLNPGRYFLIVERVFPPPGSDPDPSTYKIELK